MPESTYAIDEQIFFCAIVIGRMCLLLAAERGILARLSPDLVEAGTPTPRHASFGTIDSTRKAGAVDKLRSEPCGQDRDEVSVPAPGQVDRFRASSL